MTIRPIKTEADYRNALEQARELMHQADQASADDLEILQVLIENWERLHHPIDNVTPAKAIRFRMERPALSLVT